jgi:transposase
MGTVSKSNPHLSKEEMQERIKATVGFWRVQRWLAIWNALVDPRTAGEIALHTGLAEQSGHNLISRYNRLRPEVVEGPVKGGRRRSYLSWDEEVSFLESFKQAALTGQIATAAEIKAVIEKRIGHKVHKTMVYKLLKRQGWRKLVPRPFHVDADKEEQAAFKKLPEIIAKEPNTRDPEDSRPVLIFAQDEGRFGRISDVRRAWPPAGVRPQAPRQVIRTYLYVFTAVCPALGKMTSLILPWANTEMMNIFLRQVAEDFSDYCILMLADQAGCHTTQKLALPENIRLINLPPRSPELNPAEHIWEELREKNFANRACRDLDEVEDTPCQGLNALAKDPEKLRTMTNFPYLNITC